MQKAKIIELLNADLQDEHGAIRQYPSHAYAMGEGEMAGKMAGQTYQEGRLYYLFIKSQ